MSPPSVNINFVTPELQLIQDIAKESQLLKLLKRVKRNSKLF